MMKSQAKKLKAGQCVIWDSPGGRIEGAVVWKRYNTVKIKWEDGVEMIHYAETMSYVFTPEQLEQRATEQRLAEKIKEHNQKSSSPLGP